MLENASQNITCDSDVLQELGVQHRSVWLGLFFWSLLPVPTLCGLRCTHQRSENRGDRGL